MITAFENRKYMERVSPEKLTLKEIPNTINQAYLDGVEDVDQKYREAIQKACKVYDIPANRFFLVILNHLNN